PVGTFVHSLEAHMTVYSPLPVRRAIRARLVVFGALVASAGGAVIGLLLALAAPGASAAGTCSIYFAGTTSVAWETVTNWSLTNGGRSPARRAHPHDTCVYLERAARSH